MKTRKLVMDQATAVEEKQTTEEPSAARIESAAGGDPHSGEPARPRKHFPIRASEGSSVFRLLFPG